jgi:glucose/arabinose dehydrogenase
MGLRKLAIVFQVGCLLLIGACGSNGLEQIPLMTAPVGNIEARVLVSGLETPWDMVLAPDGSIWFTERSGIVSRADTSTGKVDRIYTLPAVEVFESGLMGMALHPDFPADPTVYLVHSYSEFFPGGDVIYNRLARWRFDGETLVERDILIERIPGGQFHNGSRLVIGPDRYLYMTTGDAGRQDLPQDIFSNAGKVLRLTLEGQPVEENPFQNEVYSYGHRNAQGIVFHPQTGDL